MFNIEEIVDKESIITYFQPIVSLKGKKIVAVEALSRGLDIKSKEIIPPLDLIDTASENNLSLELDRIFRSKAFETYKGMPDLQQSLLFVNVDTKILDSKNLEFGWTYKKAESLDLDSSNIVIEICESKIKDTEKLIRFVENYRKFGFMIAIDDFGDSHSNLERIIQIKPDIIKISRSLVDGIFNDFYKESIIKSIIQLSKAIGAVTIAEGVESKYDVMKCFELGIDLFQGFYFAKPSNCCTKDSDNCMNKIYETLFKMSDYIKNHIYKKSEKIDGFINKNEALKKELCNSSYHEIFKKLKKFIEINKDDVECIHLYDFSKNQISEFCSYETSENRNNHEIFKKSCNNSESLLKNNLDMISYDDYTVFVSDEFMSFITKNFCKTLSSKFVNLEGHQFSICIDFVVQHNDSLNSSQEEIAVVNS